MVARPPVAVRVEAMTVAVLPIPLEKLPVDADVELELLRWLGRDALHPSNACMRPPDKYVS